LLGVFLFAVFACSLVCAAEPAKPAAEDSPQKKLEGLGFSIAPQEGGKAKTSFFGAVGKGYKFVYVFDRSGSMGGSGRESLRAVKAELLDSLKRLDTVHQFQIVSYNERPTVFNPTETPGRLVFATEENQRRVARYLDTIKADGGTAHEDALRQAIRLQPDVIFFLTDADDPKLSPAQLAKIRDLAAGIIIHSIEFGRGPKPEGSNFLADLAHQNGGEYIYVDLSKRKAGGKN
jgi:hypothetical protein